MIVSRCLALLNSVWQCSKSPKIRMAAEFHTLLLRQYTTPNTLNLHDTSISCLERNSQMISECCTAAHVLHGCMFSQNDERSWPIEKITRWALRGMQFATAQRWGKRFTWNKIHSLLFPFLNEIRRMGGHLWPASIRFFSAGRFGLWSWLTPKTREN